MKFIKSPISSNNNHNIIESHPQAYYKSRLLSFTDGKSNEILEFQKLKFLKLKQKEKDTKKKFEKIAETYYKSSQMEIKIKQKELEEMYLAYQNIQMELINLQQKNSQFEKDYQSLKFTLDIQDKEFVEKENSLKAQITCLQDEKQTLTGDLTEQLKQNKLTNQQVQTQISQLNQEKINFQDQFKRTEEELKSQLESIIKQKEQLENELNQSKINYEQINDENLKLEKIAKSYYENSQMEIGIKQKELKEMHLVYQNVQMELINLQQRNSQFEQDYQNLKLTLDVQNREFEEKENTLQAQITCLQDEKQTLNGDLTEQLKQVQIQISQLNQEKTKLQDQLKQTEQELKSQQESIIKQKEQLENELNQSKINSEQINDENLKLETIAKTYYESSQMEIGIKQKELKEMHLVYQNVQMELTNLQQRNSQFEQDYQNLKFTLDVKNRKFAEKENTLQAQITCLQDEKQTLTSKLTEQLKQNKMTNQQVQTQISQLNQEKNILQDQLKQTEAYIQELKSQQESIIKQKEQLENELSQSQINYEQVKNENLKLETIAKSYYESSQMEIGINQKELKEMHLAYQKIRMELINLQQRNSQFEQDYQNLKLTLDVQNREFEEKENTLQAQITCLENDKQSLAGYLIEMFKPINDQVQSQMREKNKLQDQLIQLKTIVQELESQQENIIKQKEKSSSVSNQNIQTEKKELKQNELTNRQAQIQIGQLEQEKKNWHVQLIETKSSIQQLKLQLESLIKQKENDPSQPQIMNEVLLQNQKFSNLEKPKMEEKITQLEQKIIEKEQIEMQLEQKLIDLDYECIKKLTEERKKLVNRLIYEKNAKDVLNQITNFLKIKSDILILQEEFINTFTNKEEYNQNEIINYFIGRVMSVAGNTISNIVNIVGMDNNKFDKEFQNILNNKLVQLKKNYNSLMKIAQNNKDLKVKFIIENILKSNSFNIDKYEIFKFTTNSQEGMKTEEINSLKKNIYELKSELEQEKKELKNFED
ncbi:uncharacterized protein OCT59_009802 [Rhizophagus irregularis]|nr:hypothetical protein OCT59_009802 [Rhizophagus irregularis]CAG8673931.1 22961_t:CDS:1 [Rhizophagus irregularis]